MSVTRWSAVERIFHAALDRPTAERLAFVAGACGSDDDLRREVHSLLEQTSRPGFLDEPAIHIAATLIETPDSIAVDRPPHRRLQLQELLGKGGLTLIDVDGGAPQRLAPSIDVRGTAAWSPDGKWLVVGGGTKKVDEKDNEKDEQGLFKIPVDGGDVVPLRKGIAVDPVWSPKNDVIVFSGAYIRGGARLAVRPDGQEVPLPDVIMICTKGPSRFSPTAPA